MKTKKKKKIVRLLSSLMIVFSILNLVGIVGGIGNKACAATFPINAESLLFNGIFGAMTIAMAGIPLIIVYAVKLVVVLIGFVGQIIISGAYSSLEGSLKWSGLKSILFAGTEKSSTFLDVNFFDLSINNSALLTFRTAVAQWYYIIRLICAGILLVILIYVGIKMAISTIASEQAKYKQMLMDWVTSLALLFLLHYIIIFIITINGSLVSALKGVSEESDCTGEMISTLVGTVLSPGLSGIFSAVLYVLFVGRIFSFFILYIKRMITVGFLIMISPLITITYAIDKMGDGKAQALNAWLKELSYNILIQPFHCIIFLSFFNAIAAIVSDEPYNIGAYIFAIVIMNFMKKAEDILRKIFHFEASSMSSLSESGQNIMNATGKFVGIGMAAGGALANFKAAGGVKGAKEKLRDFRASERARKELKQYYKNEKEGKNGPPSITETSFKDYEKSVAGKEKFNKIKQSNLDQMNSKAQENRTKRSEKRQQRVKEKAEKQLREDMGDEAYEALKSRANNGDKNAQKVISDQENKVREGSFPKRTIKGVAKGASSIATNVSDGVKRFTQSDYGKLAGAAAKDSMKVAASIGMGAFALGATGELNDAVSLGQTGYGFAKGYLENSHKTIIKDSVEKTEKLAEVLGVNSSDKEAIKQMLNVVYNQGQMGNQLDTKSISNALKDLQDKIAIAVGDKGDGKRIANDLIRDLQIQMINEEKTLDIEELLDKKLKHLIDEDDQDNIKELTQNYSRIFLSSKIYANQTTGEKANMDVLEQTEKVARKISS